MGTSFFFFPPQRPPFRKLEGEWKMTDIGRTGCNWLIFSLPEIKTPHTPISTCPFLLDRDQTRVHGDRQRKKGRSKQYIYMNATTEQKEEA